MLRTLSMYPIVVGMFSLAIVARISAGFRPSRDSSRILSRLVALCFWLTAILGDSAFTLCCPIGSSAGLRVSVGRADPIEFGLDEARLRLSKRDPRAYAPDLPARLGTRSFPWRAFQAWKAASDGLRGGCGGRPGEEAAGETGDRRRLFLWAPQMTGNRGTEACRVRRAKLLLGPGVLCPPEGW